MKIVVCLKSVPDSEITPKPADTGARLTNADVKFVVNPYDEFALELAVSLKGQAEGSTVHVVTLCPAGRDPSPEIRKGALAIGADDVVVLQDPGFLGEERDLFGAARVIADQIAAMGGVDLVLFGKRHIDDDSEALGPMVATLLDLPCVASIDRFERTEAGAKVRRAIEGGAEVVEIAFPAVLTTDKGLNRPRYAALKGIMAAKKKPIEKVPAAPVSPTTTVTQMAPPAPRPEGRIIGEGPDAVPELLRLLREEAKVI